MFTFIPAVQQSHLLHLEKCLEKLYICMINLQMLIYKRFQSCVIILNQHASVTYVTIIRRYYYKNTINIQIIVQKYIYTSSYVLYLCSCYKTP